MPKLDAEQWQEARHLFHQALELEPEAQAAFLASSQADQAVLEEVRELLEQHADPSTFLDGPVLSLSATESATDSRIGPYEVREVLGRGGMGTVYRAERVDGAYSTQVAIKILHPELTRPEVEQRFRRERQILADLEHPSIARLLDGGLSDDRQQYLVLEYVEGEPIDRYCDQRRLSLRQRLELFRQVCSVVHFAHQNLVVHRDLKPANILVTADGQLKLLDFGIAKLLGSLDSDYKEMLTGTAMAPMTPEFASPEQMQGQAITTACDIYALGTLLYLLLAGRRPFQLSETSPHAFIQAVCFETPEVPSRALRRARESSHSAEWARGVAAQRGLDVLQLERYLRKDLDDIVAKALRKDPRDRYLSAQELSADVHRYLLGRPVNARHQTFWYRSGKFVRRHRWPVALAVAAFLAFSAFTIALLVQRATILQEQEHGEEVTHFLEGLFETSDPDRTFGERVTARELLDRGALDIRSRLGDQPRLQARLLATMGRVYLRLGLLAEAEPLIREALVVRRQLHGASHPEIAQSLLDLGDHAILDGEYAKALENFRAAWVMLRNTGKIDTETGVRALSRLARAHHRLGKFAMAEEYWYQSLQLAGEVLGERHHLIAGGYAELGGLLRAQGKHDEASDAYAQSLDLYRNLFGDRHPKVAVVLNDLGLLHDEQGNLEQAREVFTEALDIQADVYETEHPDLATVRHNLAALAYAQGASQEAEELARQALNNRRELFGEQHPNVADSLNLLAMVRHQQGELEDAEDLARQALEMWSDLLGDDYVRVAAARNTLAQALQAQDDLEGAEAQFTEALRVYRASFGEQHLQVATVLSNLAFVHRQSGDLEAAQEGYEQALVILRDLLGPNNTRVATVSHNLAVTLNFLGDAAGAESNFRQALEAFTQTLPEDHANLGVVRKNLAHALLEQGKAAEAQDQLEQALATFARNQIPPNSSHVVASMGLLGEALIQRGEFARAEKVLLDALENARQGRGKDDQAVVKARERLAKLEAARASS